MVKERHLKGDRTSANASLTAEQVLAIRESTEPQIVLAERYGVSDPLICLIKQGTIYTHVGGPLNVTSEKGKQYAHKLKGNVEAIRAIRLSSLPLRDLVTEYGITDKAIINIKKGTSYKSIPWTQEELDAAKAYFKKAG